MLFVLVSLVCFSILITSLGEEGAGLCVSRTFVCLFACMFLSLFSSSWCRGLAAVCDCGILPYTFLLTFLSLKVFKTDLKPKKGILYSQFYNTIGEIKVLISFNQFVKLLFCILHFCILKYTQKWLPCISGCENNEKHDV